MSYISLNTTITEVLPDDTIVEAPSLVTPLLLRRKIKRKPLVRPTEADPNGGPDPDPEPEPAPKNNETATSPDQEQPMEVCSDDIQVVKVVKADKTNETPNRRYRQVEDYIKATIVTNLTNKAKLVSDNPVLAISDYYGSAAGQLLIGIGLSRAKECVMIDDIRRLASKVKRGSTELMGPLENLRKHLVETKTSNEYYRLDTIRCSDCPFKTEFSSALNYHLEEPHVDNKKEFLCNWCEYRTKDASQIVFHNFVTHKRRCRLEKPLSLHCCRYCPFESKSKRKFTTHIFKCEQAFKPESAQGPQDFGECDYPGVTSKLITREDIRVYELTLKALRLASYNPHQIRVSGSPNFGTQGHPILVLSRASVPNSSNTHNHSSPNLLRTSISAAASPFSGPGALLFRKNNLTTDPSKQAQPQLLHLLKTQSAAGNAAQQKATILKHPKPQSGFANGMSVVKTAQNIMMPPQIPCIDIDAMPTTNGHESQSGASTADQHSEASSKGTFLICEICDGYIGNFNLFRTHMQWAHKVKIHQKMIENSKPPLNCQKCQWRFYTDQGLERHLLGSHGLVTPNLREQADKECDSGRCTICGSRLAKKLLAHMKDHHKINLKPALLSYKCTVCKATFSLYRLFENHVYKLHSQVATKGSSNGS